MNFNQKMVALAMNLASVSVFFSVFLSTYVAVIFNYESHKQCNAYGGSIKCDKFVKPRRRCVLVCCQVLSEEQPCRHKLQ